MTLQGFPFRALYGKESPFLYSMKVSYAVYFLS